jgi:hypothetical protein
MCVLKRRPCYTAEPTTQAGRRIGAVPTPFNHAARNVILCIIMHINITIQSRSRYIASP